MYSGTNPAPWPIPCRGASGRRQAAPPVPAAAGAPARCPPLITRRPSAYLTTDSCCPALRGLSARGARSRRDCALPSAPAPEMPPPHQATSRSTSPPILRTPEASRDLTGRAASSAVVLSCLVSPPPSTPVFLLVFFPLPPSSPSCSSLGSAQVNGSPSPPSWITSSRHVSFSFLFVCLFKLFFLLPPLFFSPSLPLLPCNWRLCNEFANSWTVRLLFFQIFLLCLPSPSSPLPFLSFILSLDH